QRRDRGEPFPVPLLLLYATKDPMVPPAGRAGDSRARARGETRVARAQLAFRSGGLAGPGGASAARLLRLIGALAGRERVVREARALISPLYDDGSVSEAEVIQTFRARFASLHADGGQAVQGAAPGSGK